MLHLLLGRSGTGKTSEIYRRIAQSVAKGKPVVLLVPEQFSFESERALCALLGEREALSVQVLSFTRLCHKIFYRYGKVAGNYIDRPAKYLLMSLAVAQVQEELSVYRTQAARTSFVPVALDMVGEFKNAGASPDDVLRAGRESENERLGRKLYEIGLIYQAYQAIVERSFCDPADDISRAIGLCRGRGFFVGSDVYIDSFTAFMAPEFQMIEQIMAECDELTVTACCDTLYDETGGSGLFSSANETLRRLMAAARRAGCPVASPEYLSQQHRAQSGALRHLEREYLRGGARFMGAQQEVCAIACGDIYDEIETVARQIADLTLERGYRYREIALIARDLSSYSDIILDTFARYRIPVYLDRREEVESFELVNLILSALLAVRGGLDSTELIALSKIPLLGFPEEDTFELENYCFIWDVRGRLWQNPFQNNPDGMGETMSEEQAARLGRIEAVRQGLMGPLLQLREALREPTGKVFAQAVYQYLCESGALGRLEESCGIAKEEEYVQYQSELYGQVIDILDRFYELLGDERISKPRLIELFRLAVQSCDVGKLPQTLDQVIAGTADRIRPSGIRATFVIGAVEGEFPIRFQSSGLFSDREREQIKRSGVGINTAKNELNALERFYSYFALTTPSERLTVSYPTRSVSGEEKRESVMVRAITGMFEGSLLSSAGLDPVRGLSRRENAFALLCSRYGQDSVLAASLQEFFSGGEELPRLRRAVQSVKDKNFTIEERAVATGLFGTTQALSPSRLERYYGCAFAYFCDGGLKLHRRRKVEFSPLESGSLIHYVLEYMVKKYAAGGEALPKEKELRAEICALIDDYLSERIQDTGSVDSRFRYLYTRLVNTLCRLVRRLCEEFSQSRFRPYAFELPISADAANKPVVLQTPGGNTVFVQGIVDRVDLLQDQRGKYLRVVDYKSGAKTFALTDVYYGLNMQMLIYLFALSQNGEQPLRGAFPAGVLYMPAREGVLSVERGTPPEQIAAERAKGYKMNGLLIDNISVLCDMEEGLSGLFIPAKLNRDGSLDKASKVAGLEEFGRLCRHINRLVCQMADRLIEGKVGALPASGLGYDPCRYCDYKTICRREAQGAKRNLQEMSRQELMEELKREEESAVGQCTLD